MKNVNFIVLHIRMWKLCRVQSGDSCSHFFFFFFDVNELMIVCVLCGNMLPPKSKTKDQNVEIYVELCCHCKKKHKTTGIYDNGNRNQTPWNFISYSCCELLLWKFFFCECMSYLNWWHGVSKFHSVGLRCMYRWSKAINKSSVIFFFLIFNHYLRR